MIRRARPADAPAVCALATAFATSFAVDADAFARSYAELLTTPHGYLAVAEENTGLVGYLLGFDHATFFANGRVAWVEEVMVAEGARRRGVGEALMATFEQWSAGRGAVLVALATRRAAHFYRALGYEHSAEYFRKLL